MHHRHAVLHFLLSDDPFFFPQPRFHAHSARFFSTDFGSLKLHSTLIKTGVKQEYVFVDRASCPFNAAAFNFRAEHADENTYREKWVIRAL